MKKSLKLPPYVQVFMDTFRKAGFTIHLVGGSVRDLLLDRPVDNWDFASSATPEEVLELFPDATYENDFGTVIVSTETEDGSKTICEITPYRNEDSYDDNRHPKNISWAKTIEEDVKRRDFTINAIAFDGKELLDLTDGLKDLDNKIIRAVGDPNTRFQEDALRLMRAIRFATQLEFFIEEKTAQAIMDNSELIQNISWERIRDEFMKIISSNHPADGILFLKHTGLLKVILPEVEECFGVEQKSPERHHIYDVGTHLVETLRNTPSKDPITRLAALLHDAGKPTTREIDENGVTTFYNHEIIGANIAHTIATRLRLSKKDAIKLVTLVRYHMFSVGEDQTDKAVRRFVRKVGLENLDNMLDLRTGDRIGSGAKPTSWRTELFKKRLDEVQQVPFEIKDMQISGHDVMSELSIKPSRRIGEILEEIFEEVEDGNLPNEREALLEKLRTYKEN